MSVAGLGSTGVFAGRASHAWGYRGAFFGELAFAARAAGVDWLFGGADVAETLAPSGVASLAPVRSGWSGTLRILSGPGEVVHEPAARTSAFEVIDTAVRQAARVCGGTWAWWVDTAGRLIVTSTQAFDVVVDGVCATRMGWTATTYGADAYVAGAVIVSGIVPSIGLLLDGADGIATRGAALASGRYVSGVVAGEQRGAVVLHGAFDELVGLVDDLDAGGTWDVQLAGTWAARVRVDGLERVQRSSLPALCEVVVSTVAVTL